MLTIHIVSLFPEIIHPYLNESIPKRAQEKGLFRYFSYNLTDWTVRNTRRVDDRPYWWFPGTIITIEPLVNALRDIYKNYSEMPTYYMSPGWSMLKQEILEEISQNKKEGDICIICGHYEWVDERIFSLFPIKKISLGEYVLSSGELAALVFIDGIVRLIPWVITEDSLEEESFSKKLWRRKEYPQYSRPSIFEWIEVPEVLLSWNHGNIKNWKETNIWN